MNENEGPVRILFVCLGNICRSPTAQGVAEQEISRRGLQGRVEVDSAGTGSWHIGSPPDRRAVHAAADRGIDLSRQRARQVHFDDFHRFDFIMAMDEANFRDLVSMAPAGATQKVSKVLTYSDLGVAEDVPDPYYGGSHGFEQVLDLLENALGLFFDQLNMDHASGQGAR
ncbi:MAG: low molecular weight protein-tyrosine-phosphatase [Xanthomonadales bacterium]|nr:low molecular weight protein-tyrosine-phosphatase [Xanthomonadales bacterium]